MATPKELHDARELARASRRRESTRPDEEIERELARPMAASGGAEEQGDGQPENELELHDHSGGAKETGDPKASGVNSKPV
jgi:hypothetical protein